MRQREDGFGYLMLLLWVAVGGVGLAALGTVWGTVRQQQDESELLYVGHQYRQAIGSYYRRGTGLINRYPASLEDLLKDPRTPGIERHLRQPYRDPVANSETWELIRAPEGGIMGVRSSSRKRPLKLANFEGDNRVFEDLAAIRGDGLSHADWEFVYLPSAAAVAGAGAGQ